MSRSHFKWGFSNKRTRPRAVVSLITVIAVEDKKYNNSLQAAISIAHIITSNLDIKYGGRKAYKYDTGWDEEKKNFVYKKALRRLKPICKRILSSNKD